MILNYLIEELCLYTETHNGKVFNPLPLELYI